MMGSNQLKLFWRAKKDAGKTGEPNGSQKQAATADAESANEPAAEPAKAETSAASRGAEGKGADAVADAATAQTQDANEEKAAAIETSTASNIVTLQPTRLAERIAAAATATVSTFMPASQERGSLVRARGAGAIPGQQTAYEALARALESPRAGAHILVMGTPGSGRHTASRAQVELLRKTAARPKDWLYAAAPGEGRRLRAFALPHGQGAMFAREVRAAIARATANHERLVSSDDYRIGLEIIDEEFRHRTGKTLDTLKRRAEGQNIALVKTPEGFVLAPMHEGKVVRNDVFRALPETLQRDVETKIAGLEGELKVYIESLPAEDAAQGERVATFNRETAARAVKPHFESVRLAFADAAAMLDALEASLIASAAAGAHAGKVSVPDVQVLAAQTASDFSESAPFVVANDVSPAGLLGEVGLDGAGRIALSPGDLMRANGGYMLVDAWRLAQAPAAWAALSAALETAEIRPRCADGLVVTIDPLPLSIKVVMIADVGSLRRLSEIDPGLMRLFPHIVKLPSSVPRAELDAGSFAALLANLAEGRALRPLLDGAASALYDELSAHSGGNSHLTFDLHELTSVLCDADLRAEAARSDAIRAADIAAAVTYARENPLT